jgi:adenylosuccinate synthase
MDKTARHGIRMAEMLDEEAFADRVEAHVEAANRLLTKVYDAEPLDSKLVAAEYLEYARALQPHIGDTVGLIAKALQAGETVLAEGAQGTLLDLDHGTYPYVTSSNPTAPGALIGLGVGPLWVNQVIGVAKAFQTRVGEGGFPTELEGDMAVRLRGTGENPWDEFGTTTGRPRRVGWLDLVLLRYAARVNGFTHLTLTKMDILSGLKTIKLCVSYQREGVTYPNLPLGVYQLETYTPVYEEMPGWEEDIQSARQWADLPAACQNYVRRIEDQVGVKVGWVSVGPEREQMVQLVSQG